MTKFLSLACPRMFMYGEQSSSHSYLPTLAANEIELAEISHGGHWPMHSNPRCLVGTDRRVPHAQRLAPDMTRRR